MNRKLLAAAVAGALAPMAAQAVDFGVSGHVNRMIRYADDGIDSDVQHLDHGGAFGSRFRIRASGELDSGLMAGATIEHAFASNVDYRTPLNAGGANEEAHEADGGSNDDVRLRHSFLWLSGSFGKLSLGHTSPAGSGVMWMGDSGAWRGHEYSTVDAASAVQLRTSGGGMAGSSLWGAFGSVSFSREDILKYDTPAIGPAALSVSIDSNDNWALEATMSTEMGGSSFSGGAFVGEVPGSDERKFGLAGGVSFPNGTSVKLAYGSDDSYSRDHDDFYAGLGHSWGNSSVAIGYRFVDAKNALFDDAQSIGLGFNQSLGSGVNVFAGLHNHSFDGVSADVEDVNVFHIGAEVAFE
jgi:hypothetical protein